MLSPSLTQAFAPEIRGQAKFGLGKRDREEILSNVCTLETNALRRLYILTGKSRALIHFRMCFLSWSESYIAH